MAFALSSRSLGKLERVHPDLVKVVKRAIKISDLDFVVTCGPRTIKEQEALVAAGASQTMKSNHLIQADGFAHAVDLAALVNGKIRWDWPLYSTLAIAMKSAADEFGVEIVWGGDWRTFKDGPHFQLSERYRRP